MASADSLCPWHVSFPPPVLKDTYGVRRLPVSVACVVPTTNLEGYQWRPPAPCGRHPPSARAPGVFTFNQLEYIRSDPPSAQPPGACTLQPARIPQKPSAERVATRACPPCSQSEYIRSHPSEAIRRARSHRARSPWNQLEYLRSHPPSIRQARSHPGVFTLQPVRTHQKSSADLQHDPPSA